MMGWLLFGLSWWTTVTGLAGVWLQRTVPRVLSRRLSVEAIYERIPELVARARRRGGCADDRRAGGARARLCRRDPSGARHLAPERDVADRHAAGALAAAGSLARLRPFAAGADRARLDDLESILQDKSDLDAQLSLQGMLRGWLIVHVPPAMLLIGVMASHVIAVVWH